MIKRGTKSTRFKPSMREKRRYLVLLSSPHPLHSLLSNLEKGGWKVMEHEKGKSLLRVKLKYLNNLKKVLASNSIPCVGISGTVKKAKQKFWSRY